MGKKVAFRIIMSTDRLKVRVVRNCLFSACRDRPAPPRLYGFPFRFAEIPCDYNFVVIHDDALPLSMPLRNETGVYRSA